MVSSRECELPLEEMMPLIREQLARGESVRLSPRGVSMLPMLRQETDSVVLSPLPPKLKKYDLPLYRRKNGKYILHRIVAAGETYSCMGDNQFFVERGIEPEQMLALVTAFYRGDRLHQVNEPAYRFYCFFWHHSRRCRRFYRRLHRFLRRCLGR